ncbi:MAG: hypothetical protein V5A34_01030 [Halapricum sp.]
MSIQSDALGELFVEITGTEVVTEPQKEILSHEPHTEAEAELDRAVSGIARHKELKDAVGSPENEQ